MSPKLRNWFIDPGLISPLFGRRSIITIDGQAQRILLGQSGDLVENLTMTSEGILLAYDPYVWDSKSRIYATEKRKMAQAALCGHVQGTWKSLRVYIIEFSEYRGNLSTEMPWFPDDESETNDFVSDSIINNKANLDRRATVCTSYEATSDSATFWLEEQTRYGTQPGYTRHYVYTNDLGSFTVSVMYYTITENGNKKPVKYRIDNANYILNPGFITGVRNINSIPSYLPANMRAITFNDTPVYPVTQGIRGQTRYQSPSTVNVLRKLYEEIGDGFDIAIRTFYTNYAVFYVRFLPSTPFSSSQLYIRVPQDYKEMYAVLTVDVESLVIDGIYPSGLNLLTSDTTQFTTNTIEKVTANAAMLGAIIGGNIISGIGNGVQAYANYKQWQEQLGWYKESQQNMLDFSREYQGKQYAQQRNMAVLNTELAGYRTGASAYGFSHTNTSTAGLGYTPSDPIRVGKSTFVSNWDPAAHLPESKRIHFVRGKSFNEQGTDARDSDPDEIQWTSNPVYKPLEPHQQVVQAEIHNEDTNA